MTRRLPRRAKRVEPNLVWMLGSPRSGSTWLLTLLAQNPRVIGIDEPGVGAHLGVFAAGIFPGNPQHVPSDRLRINDLRADVPSYFLSRRYRRVWRPLVRELVLGRLGAEIEDTRKARGIRDPIAVLKEPNGSQGADVLMSALPGSRLLFLLRDGRDVVDSELDAATPGAWAAEEMKGFATPPESDRVSFVRARAHAWLCRIDAVQRAYDGHPPDLRLLVRYEDLLKDTEGELRRVLEWLGLEADSSAIEAAVSELAFDRISPEDRGSGRFARAATPGLWRENLSADEQRAIDDVIGPRLRELGYDGQNP